MTCMNHPLARRQLLQGGLATLAGWLAGAAGAGEAAPPRGLGFRSVPAKGPGAAGATRPVAATRPSSPGRRA